MKRQLISLLLITVMAASVFGVLSVTTAPKTDAKLSTTLTLQTQTSVPLGIKRVAFMVKLTDSAGRGIPGKPIYLYQEGRGVVASGTTSAQGYGVLWWTPCTMGPTYTAQWYDARFNGDVRYNPAVSNRVPVMCVV